MDTPCDRHAGAAWVIDFGRGNTRAGDARGTPTQSRVSPSILVYEDETGLAIQEWLQGYLADKKAPTPQGPPRILGIGLL